MNIMNIEIETKNKEGYLEISDLMSKNAPCIAFARVKFLSASFIDKGYVYQYFVSVHDGKKYYAVTSGQYFYDLALKAMAEGDEPILEVEYET